MAGENGTIDRRPYEYIVPAFGLKDASKLKGEELSDAIFSGVLLGGRSSERFRYRVYDGDFFDKFERFVDPKVQTRYYTYLVNSDGREVKIYTFSEP